VIGRWGTQGRPWSGGAGLSRRHHKLTQCSGSRLSTTSRRIDAGTFRRRNSYSIRNFFLALASMPARGFAPTSGARRLPIPAPASCKVGSAAALRACGLHTPCGLDYDQDASLMRPRRQRAVHKPRVWGDEFPSHAETPRTYLSHVPLGLRPRLNERKSDPAVAPTGRGIRGRGLSRAGEFTWMPAPIPASSASEAH